MLSLLIIMLAEGLGLLRLASLPEWQRELRARNMNIAIGDFPELERLTIARYMHTR